MSTTKASVESPSPMSFEEFIRNFNLPPIVPIARSREMFGGCSRSMVYKMRRQGKLRIVEIPRGSGVPVEDHYRIYLKAFAA